MPRLRRAAVTANIGSARVPVVCAEDLVAMKVLGGPAARPRRCHRGPHVRGHDLDLERTGATLGLLERALAGRREPATA